MVGNKQPPKNDPFVAGQFIGMLTILMFVEENNGINKEFLYKLKQALGDKAAGALEKPAEDIYLIVEDLVNKIKI